MNFGRFCLWLIAVCGSCQKSEINGDWSKASSGLCSGDAFARRLLRIDTSYESTICSIQQETREKSPTGSLHIQTLQYFRRISRIQLLWYPTRVTVLVVPSILYLRETYTSATFGNWNLIWMWQAAMARIFMISSQDWSHEFTVDCKFAVSRAEFHISLQSFYLHSIKVTLNMS